MRSVRSSRIKKVIFYAVIVAVNCVFLELVAYGFFRAKYGEFSRAQLQQERLGVVASVQTGPVFTGKEADTTEAESKKQEQLKEIIHPYAGYTVQGSRSKSGCNLQADNPWACKERVARPEDSPMPKRNDHTLNVALLGGSVAVGTVNGAPPNYYQKRLAALPEYQGRNIVLHMLAAGGYRQPQPLMLLNYYQTLGAEYDLVIALDGFNEIAIAGTEYKRHKIHPSFPRSWKFRMSDKVSPDLILLLAEKVALEKKHIARATFFSSPLPRNSVTFNLLWKVMHSNFSAQLSTLNTQAEQAQVTDADTPEEFQFEGIGPRYPFTDWETLFEYSAALWGNSTLLSNSAAKTHGGKFFHFLQPNQYIEGAKPTMSAAERAVAFSPAGKGGYGNWYKKGYSYLKKEQARVQKMGVHSVDLTYLYEQEAGEIYIDSCCHVNSKGSAMIVEAIVDEIHRVNTLNSQPQP